MKRVAAYDAQATDFTAKYAPTWIVAVAAGFLQARTAEDELLGRKGSESRTMRWRHRLSERCHVRPQPVGDHGLASARQTLFHWFRVPPKHSCQAERKVPT